MYGVLYQKIAENFQKYVYYQNQMEISPLLSMVKKYQLTI